MPSILEQKLKNKQSEQTTIAAKIEKQQIHATNDERYLLDSLVREISELYKNELSDVTIDRTELDRKIEETIKANVDAMDVSFEQRKRLEKLAIMNIIGLGPIQPLINNKDITEIVVQRYDNICVEINGLVKKVNATFSDEENLKNIINRILQPISRLRDDPSGITAWCDSDDKKVSERKNDAG